MGDLSLPIPNLSDSWLIVGGDGLIGSALHGDLIRHGFRVTITSLHPPADRQETVLLDLSRSPDDWPDLPRCAVAVLAAGVANLEQCRREPKSTRQINVAQTLRLAERLANRGTFVVFISSNLVFDGTKPERKPDEPVCPVTEYGRQKAEAEAALLKLREQCAIVRLTKVFHLELELIKTWRERLSNGKTIHPFFDYLCAPVTLKCVAESIRLLAQNRRSGIWHVSPREHVSYAEIATHLANCNDLDASLVQPISAPRHATEHLPQFSTLDSRQLEATIRLQIPSANQTVEDVLKPG